jgi:hypothetical protein
MTIKHHPEQQEDEIYMGNIYYPFQLFNNTLWKTRRLGKMARYNDGSVIEDNNAIPWFIQRKEVEETIQFELENPSFNSEEKIREFRKMLKEGKVIF